MSKELKLYDLPPSPNNMKAHIGLNYKELQWERVVVDMQDRGEVIKVSGQPLTPVLVHGETVVFDSAAILRYLDGNFPKTRPLFSKDRETMYEIQEWERFSWREVGPPVGMVFGQAFAPEKDASVLAEADRLIREATGKLEARLEQGSFLVGDDLTAADVTVAPWVHYAALSEEQAGATPIHKLFYETLKLGDGRDRTRAWLQKVMKHDS